MNDLEAIVRLRRALDELNAIADDPGFEENRLGVESIRGACVRVFRQIMAEIVARGEL